MPLRKVRYRREPVGDINITNLIDIIMVLLVVFILVSNFVTTGLNINLPKVKYVQSIGKESIVIAISAGGKVTLNSETIAMDNLPAKLAELKEQHPEESVFIHSDSSAVVQDLMNVFSIASEVGFTSVNVAGIQDDKS